ncbi:MAG: FAD-dependent oxidoreductase [Gammaproteobacteria bacterium]|nr:FAD-dependent oxidoreductase [Gammaproteobacteria bacterium]
MADGNHAAKRRRRCDVVITGGGLYGASTAYHLLAREPALRVGIVEPDSRLHPCRLGPLKRRCAHPGTYYERLEECLPGHDQPVGGLAARGIVGSAVIGGEAG